MDKPVGHIVIHDRAYTPGAVLATVDHLPVSRLAIMVMV